MSENDLNFNNQSIDNNPQNFNEQEAPLINNINNYEPQILNNANNIPQQQNPNEIQITSNMNSLPNNFNNPQINNNQNIQNNSRQIQIHEPYINQNYYEPIMPNDNIKILKEFFQIILYLIFIL